jgi:hypothetical protein
MKYSIFMSIYINENCLKTFWFALLTYYIDNAICKANFRQNILTLNRRPAAAAAICILQACCCLGEIVPLAASMPNITQSHAGSGYGFLPGSLYSAPGWFKFGAEELTNLQSLFPKYQLSETALEAAEVISIN